MLVSGVFTMVGLLSYRSTTSSQSPTDPPGTTPAPGLEYHKLEESFWKVHVSVF